VVCIKTNILTEIEIDILQGKCHRIKRNKAYIKISPVQFVVTMMFSNTYMNRLKTAFFLLPVKL
jgi:hypothetical protein